MLLANVANITKVVKWFDSYLNGYLDHVAMPWTGGDQYLSPSNPDDPMDFPVYT